MKLVKITVVGVFQDEDRPVGFEFLGLADNVAHHLIDCGADIGQLLALDVQEVGISDPDPDSFEAEEAWTELAHRELQKKGWEAADRCQECGCAEIDPCSEHKSNCSRWRDFSDYDGYGHGV
jgi:hypothetical protein